MGVPFTWRLYDAFPQWLTGLPLEEGKHRCQDGLIDLYYPSTCASAASTWGNQNIIVIQ